MLDDAVELVHELASRRQRVVFAESCTGGLIASELAKIPGVSQWFCGSAVTYREDTKVNWLGVRTVSLEAHTDVSCEVTDQMAEGVLKRTPEASIAAAVTGHLGPEAPTDLDGVVFISIALRHQQGIDVLPATRHPLQTRDREARQREAARLVMQCLIEQLRSR